jgi:1-acyl-sn-glycerol-3-phosphate acyltransferase
MIAAAVAGTCRLIGGSAVQWHCDPHASVQRIYFGNHSSHLDFIFMWSALPPRLRPFGRPVAGRDYWERTWIRRRLASDVFHAVLIDRAHGPTDDRAAAARASVERMADEMGTQNSLFVFPEGTRSANCEIAPFKSGLYHLARLRPDAELIPVHLENLNRILPKGEFLPVPMLSRVVFGPPFRPAAESGKEQFLSEARTALVQLKELS